MSDYIEFKEVCFTPKQSRTLPNNYKIYRICNACYVVIEYDKYGVEVYSSPKFANKWRALSHARDKYINKMLQRYI